MPMVSGNGLADTVNGYTLTLRTPPATTIPAAATFTITHDGNTVTQFDPEQTKLMHFYLIRSDLTGFSARTPQHAAGRDLGRAHLSRPRRRLPRLRPVRAPRRRRRRSLDRLGPGHRSRLRRDSGGAVAPHPALPPPSTATPLPSTGRWPPAKKHH